METPEMGCPFAELVTVPEMTPEGLSAMLAVVVAPAVTETPVNVVDR